MCEIEELAPPEVLNSLLIRVLPGIAKLANGAGRVYKYITNLCGPSLSRHEEARVKIQ